MAARSSLWIIAGLLLCGSATPAAAQVLGLPVVNNGVPVGIAFGADVGFTNAAYGDGRAIGANAIVGVGIVAISASVSRFLPDAGGDSYVSPGGAVSLQLFGGPLVPFRVTLQGGFARWGEDVVYVTSSASLDPVYSRLERTSHLAMSLGLAATLPIPGFAVRPWVAPRIDMIKRGSSTRHDFAVSGGIEAAMLSGVRIRAAYDRVFAEDGYPSILSFGVGFAP